jgi:hypothetical protein
LSGHEQLPHVRRSSLIRLADDAEDRKVGEHERERATDIPIGRKRAWVFHHRVHQYVRSAAAFLDDSIFSPPFAAQDADETRVRCAAANQ